MASSRGERKSLARGPSGRAARLQRWSRLHAATPLYLAPALALYGAFVLWPLLQVAVLSVERWDGYGSPTFAGLSNFADLWADPGFPAELEHSATWLLVTLTVPTVLGLLLALLLQALPHRLRLITRALLLVPLALPTVVIAVAWRLVYNPVSGPLTGLLRALHLAIFAGDWLGDPRLALPALLVAACWGSYPLSLLLCEAGLARVDGEQIDAARLDGAGSLALFWAVRLPAVRDVLPLAVIATGFSAVPSYDLVSVLTGGGPGYATTMLSLDSFDRAFGMGQVGSGAALGAMQAMAGVLLAAAALLVARGAVPTGDGLNTVQADGENSPQAALPLLLAPVAVFAALAPLLWLVVLTMRPSLAGPGWPALADNVARLWSGGLKSAIANSGCTALAVGVLATAIALPAAFALATTRQRRWKGGAVVLLAVGLFQPLSVLIIPLFEFLRTVGLLNTLAGVAAPQVGRALAVTVPLLWLGMRGLPPVILEAAALDGAPPRRVLVHIVIPLLRPFLVAAAAWAFLLSWNDYLLPLAVLSGTETETVPMALAHFVGRSDTEYSLLATGALLALVPAVTIFVLLYGMLAPGRRRSHR